LGTLKDGDVTKNASTGQLNIPDRPIGIAVYDRNLNPTIELTKAVVQRNIQ
jgi:hypothetical protein